MTRREWVVVFSGTIIEVDLLRCLLDGAGIDSQLQNETIGMMVPTGAVADLAIERELLNRARPIVEDYINNKSRRLREV